ncbi:hypothetical protein ROLI_016190 [Roseobacter fucihabitans]|uniref:Uncharacterized protein n=1 Tax=Roseobacter fucihabitans TaxID=1537242 RepID=A0ABZ2BS54_9RHOB|nr:hypothetical protein [Roseobacter litoralis]
MQGRSGLGKRNSLRNRVTCRKARGQCAHKHIPCSMGRHHHHRMAGIICAFIPQTRCAARFKGCDVQPRIGRALNPVHNHQIEEVSESLRQCAHWCGIESDLSARSARLCAEALFTSCGISFCNSTTRVPTGTAMAAA